MAQIPSIGEAVWIDPYEVDIDGLHAYPMHWQAVVQFSLATLYI